MLGANKCVYAPEPIDVGRVLQADISSNGLKVTLTTDGPIEQGRRIIEKSSGPYFVLYFQLP